jgi:hypothetical protein
MLCIFCGVYASYYLYYERLYIFMRASLDLCKMKNKYALIKVFMRFSSYSAS